MDKPEKPPHWPDGVEQLTFEHTAKLGVGRDNQLYWDGKPIVTKSKISLPWFVNVAAVAAGLAAVVMAGLDILRFLQEV